MNETTRRRLAALGVSEDVITAAEDGTTLEPVDLAALDEETRQLAADLYRAMNESVSEHLASLDPQRRTVVFAMAEDGLDADAHSRMPADLLRAFTEALLLVDPAYDDPRHDPTLRGLSQVAELVVIDADAEGEQ